MCTRTITYKQLSAGWSPTASPKYIDVSRPTKNLQRLYGLTMWLWEHTCRYVIGFCCAVDEKGVSVWVSIVGTKLVTWVGSWLAWGNLGEMTQVGGSVVIPEMDLLRFSWQVLILPANVWPLQWGVNIEWVLAQWTTEQRRTCAETQ